MRGGGGNLVDGVRRWLFSQRRPSPSSSSNNHDQIHDPDNLVDDGDLNEVTTGIVDFDPSRLKQIKVPKRHRLPMDGQKKVVDLEMFPVSFFEISRTNHENKNLVSSGN